MGLLKTLLTLFIFSLPIAELGRFQYQNGIAVTLNEVILVLLLLSWVLYRIKRKDFSLNTSIFRPVVIFSSIAFISLVLNLLNLSIDRFFVSFLYLLRWVSYLSLFFIVKDIDNHFKKKIPILLLFSGTVVVLGGYIQYFFYPSLRNLYYLGWDEHLYRMFSSFLDPNFLGAYLVLLLILILGILYKKITSKNRLQLFSISILGIVTLIATYLTYSRSALLMLIVSVTTFLFLIGKRRLVFISVILLLLFVFLLPKSFKTEGTNFLRTASSEARFSSSEVAIKIFEGSPIYGVGFNAYRYAQNKYGLNNQYWMVTHSGAGTDNSFLFVLATTGTVGLLSFIYLLVSLFILAKNNFKNNIYSVVLFSSLLGLLVDSIFINSLFYVFVLEWIWIIAALTESK